MIDICVDYCDTFCLQFNSKKSKCMVFGKDFNSHKEPLTINDAAIEYVAEWRYLGTTITNGKCFAFSARPDLAAFFRATNAVINVLL